MGWLKFLRDTAQMCKENVAALFSLLASCHKVSIVLGNGKSKETINNMILSNRATGDFSV